MKKYTIVKADLKNNKYEILAILKRNLPHISEQGYEWGYENSPYGNAQCWLAKENTSNLFVGSGALFPRQIFVNGQPVYAGVAGDFAVDKEHRAYGPALKLQKSIQTNSKLSFIYGIPNKQAEAIFLRIGYVEIGRYSRYVKILKTEYKFKQYIRPILFTKKFSKIIDLIIKKLSKENRYKRPSNFSIEIPTYFDERFDDLWTKASKQCKIIGERNARFLNWRYKQSPHQDFKIFTLIKDKKSIAGYIIYYLRENTCHIVDLVFIDLDGIIDCLFAEFILYMREKNVDSISVCYLGNSLLIRKLKEFNFLLRKKESNKLLINIDKTSPFVFSVLNKNNWHFLEGDNDR